ncbi:exopolysaccharide biosynthesis polyprenyl glycosylphosphotransferase [Polynucleobacter sp. 71A-WALBACH]|nr:exopolysaccharide biosynthesis polyprenyl glycosylphosphotransferase [Polynucleobacter sp. 71A-WALBACH]
MRFYDKSIPNNLYYLLLLISGFLFIAFNGIRTSSNSHRHLMMIANISKGWLMSYGLILLSIIFTQSSLEFSRLWLAVWGLTTWLALIFVNFFVHRYIYRHARSSPFRLKVAIIGNNPTGEKLMQAIMANPWLDYQLIGDLNQFNETVLQQLGNQTLDEIWVCPSPSEMAQLGKTISLLGQSSARIRLSVDLSDYHLLNHGIGEINSTPMIDLSAPPFSGINAFIKLIEDYLISCVILILLSPAMLVIAILVKLNSPGPIFYRQKRIGLNGREFEMLKFRSMPVDTEKLGIQWGSSDKKVKDKLSLFLRKYNLDELPQFFNVLTGEMSIVGPRPERTEFISEFSKEIQNYNKKHLVKAGITGWAQVNGLRGDTNLHKRIEYDLYYIEHWSLLLDLKIILLTVLEPFLKKHYSNK